MRKLMCFAATAAGLYGAVRWWRQNRRAGADFVNRIVDPWLEGHGVIRGSHGELGLIEHIGRKSGTVRRTPVHPMPTADGFRIIVPIGDKSQWARNVLAAGHCRLELGDRQIELDEPVLEQPADVSDLPRPVRALFEWLGFRYLRLRTLREVQSNAVFAAIQHAPCERGAVPA
jgi:deazaflavin-dependent oxidoreductase (nitroreductase family)